MVVSISGHHNNRMVPTSALLANRGSCVCHSKVSQICFDVQQRAGNHGCGFPPRAEWQGERVVHDPGVWAFLCSYILRSAPSSISSRVSPSCHSAKPMLKLIWKLSRCPALFQLWSSFLIRSITF
jgi:hypothetical protein